MSLHNRSIHLIHIFTGNKLSDSQASLVLIVLSLALIALALFQIRASLDDTPEDISDVEHFYDMPVDGLPPPPLS